MSRQAAVITENNFVGGLITETTELRFPPNSCTDVDNCVFDFSGTVTRRNGFEYEDSYVLNTITPVSGEAWTEFSWTAVAGLGTKNFLVQQQGDTIRFFDTSTSLAASANLKSFTITLSTYVPPGSAFLPREKPCQYATSNGYLIIVNQYINPIYIAYDSIGDSITVTTIKPKIRDVVGLDDGLAVFTRPGETSLANLKTNQPLHYYNLLNQGWGQTDSLTQWDTARSDFPSNADILGLYRSSATDAFDNANVTANGPGNTPAPKGHFILEAAKPDRVTAMSDEGFTGAAIPGPTTMISGATGTNIGDAFPLANAFDTSNSTVAFKASTSMYVGKNYSSVGGFRLAQAVLKSPSSPANQFGFLENVDQSMTITIYGKATLPANATDGTSLGTTTFTDTTSQSNKTIISTDTATSYNYIWATLTTTPSATIVVGSVEFYTFSTTGTYAATDLRFKTTASFAGRIWYGGIDGLNLNSSLFFSRIVNQPSDFEKCYQNNDPASEENPDFLPDDGGVIRIPEIGSIVKIFAYQTSLLVFATNGVWRVSGGSSSAFRANDYSVRKITSVGMNAPLSVTDARGIPMWWAEDGIYTIKYDANYDSFEAISITDQTIASFYQGIPAENRKYAKGVYDVFNKVTYWIYSSDPEATDFYRYNKVLCLDGLINAFYPWTISSNDDGYVKGVSFALDASQTSRGEIKYTITGGTDQFTYAEHNDEDLYDWTISNTTPADYDSYFITGYRVDGQAIKFFQSNYVFVFLDTLEDSSCYMQGLFDWTNSSSSGKWSSSQQIYNSGLLYRGINFRKLKVRGKGRAMQLKFYSEAGKPFSIIGWSIQETSNASI